MSRAKYIKDSGVKCDWIVVYDVDYVEVIYWMERAAAYKGHSCILTTLWKLLDIIRQP